MTATDVSRTLDEVGEVSLENISDEQVLAIVNRIVDGDKSVEPYDVAAFNSAM